MKQLFASGALVWLAACSKQTAPPDAPGSSSEAIEQAATPVASAYAIDLQSLFGAQIELATGLPVNELRGDFTGDTLADRAFLVKSSSFPPNQAPDVQVLRLFQPAQPGALVDVQRGAPMSMVLVHAGPSFPTATIIVHDAEADGRLAYAAKQGVRLVKHAELAMPLAQLAKGDVLALASQGATQYLYWDGTTYQLSEGKFSQ